jgi:F-type H+-transporting ATPase subunit b
MAEGHHTIELVWKGLNILLFLAIVYYFGRKHIRQAFEGFFSKLTEGLESSERELKEAKETLERAKAEYEDAKRRHTEQIELAKQTAQQMKEEELKKIEEIASRIKEKAKETIELETKKAKEELLRFGMRQAKELALQRLFQDFENPDIQKKYAEKMLRKLEVQK